jgi:uncharacterized membrane protein (UPF0127 family)
MSNKTPTNNTAATASAPKHKKSWPIALFGVMGFVAIGLLVFFVLNPMKLADHQPCLRYVTVDDNRKSKCLVHLEVVQDLTSQEKGLSGRASLPLNRGMLFVYPGDDIRCMWMKDMNFHLDMVWLNANKEIVHIQHDAAPETYPATFCPETPATYVLEINAGEAKNLQLKEGQQLQF